MFNDYKKFSKILLVSTILTTTSAAYAEYDKFAIGANIGLSGIGGEGRVPITDKVYGRLGANYFGYKYNSPDTQGIKYKLKLTLLTVPLMVDFHPFDNSGFRLSAGVAYNGNEIKGSVNPTENITLYGHTYTPRQVGSINASFKYKNKIAPIVSLGYDSSLRNDSAVSFNFEAGVMYSGKANIRTTATGLLNTQTQFLADINRNADDSLSSIQKYLKLFPVVSLGIKFSF